MPSMLQISKQHSLIYNIKSTFNQIYHVTSSCEGSWWESGLLKLPSGKGEASGSNLSPSHAWYLKSLSSYGRWRWDEDRALDRFWQRGCPSVVGLKPKINDALYQGTKDLPHEMIYRTKKKSIMLFVKLLID